jgi:hypothetical protein
MFIAILVKKQQKIFIHSILDYSELFFLLLFHFSYAALAFKTNSGEKVRVELVKG